MKPALILFTLILAGCTSIKAASARSVVVESMDRGDAQRVASAECAKHSRIAEYSHADAAYVYVFRCVD